MLKSLPTYRTILLILFALLTMTKATALLAGQASAAATLSDQAIQASRQAEAQGQFETAETTLRRALDQALKSSKNQYTKPVMSLIEAQLGFYLRQQNWMAAIAILEPMRLKLPPGVQEYEIHYLLAEINEKAERPEVALRAYLKTRSLFAHTVPPLAPDNSELLGTHLGIAKLLASQGKATAAEKEMQALLATLGNDPEQFADARFKVLTQFKRIAQQNKNSALTQQLDAQILAIGKNQLLTHMQKFYLWNDSLPGNVNGSFKRIEEVLDALKHKPDDHWSYITPLEDAQSARRGEFVGIGLDFTPDQQRRLRVSFVTPGSPAAHAGAQRGDIIEGMGGKPLAELRASPELYEKIWGENRAGVTVRIDLVSADGQEKPLDIRKDKVHSPAIPVLQIIEDHGRKVGYLYVTSFLSLTEKDIDDAVTRLKQAGIEDLVVDLRYNGGGSVYISAYLAAAIAGDAVKGKIYQRLKFNPLIKRADEDKFPAPAKALNLKRLAVLATEDTCSASEALVNGLRPFIPVTLIGSPTCGKPVGMQTIEIGPWMLAPITFRLYNALDQGEYFAGLKPDCAMVDDLDRPLGSRDEAMLGEALKFFNTGECSGFVSRGKPPRLRDVVGPGKTGLRREIGVF